MPTALTQLAGTRRAMVLRATAVISFLAFAVLSVWRSAYHGQIPIVDMFLFNIPFAACAAVCLTHRPPNRLERRAWLAAAAAMIAFLVGNVWYSIVIAPHDGLLYPSIADGASLIAYLLLYAFVGLLIRAHHRVLSAGVRLDGLVAALGLAALAGGGLIDAIRAVTGGTFAQVSTDLAAALADAVLVVIVLTAGAVYGGRMSRTYLCIVAAGVAAGVADTSFMLQQSTGAYAEGGYIDLLYLAVPTLLALAPSERPSRQRRNEPGAALTTGAVPAMVGWQALNVPAFFAISSLVLLVLGQTGRVSLVTTLLAAACVMTALLRAGLTFKELRDLHDVHRQARTDDLTGLPNRRALLEAADRLCATGARGSLLMLDLDGFKQVNDALGHAGGDRVLAQVAERAGRVLDGRHLLARLGGDEFAILAPEVSLDDAVSVGRRVHEAIVAPSELDGVQIRLGVSIGATETDGRTTAGELLQTADDAMYKAKRSGGGVVAVECASEAGASSAIAAGRRQTLASPGHQIPARP